MLRARESRFEILGPLLVILVLCIAVDARAQELAPVPPPPQPQPQPYVPPPPQQQPYVPPPPQQQPYVPPPPQQQSYAPPPQQQPYAPPPPTGAPGEGGYYVAGQPGAQPVAPRTPADPGRRPAAEIVELYITMAGVGTLSGLAVAAALDSDETYPWILFPAFGGLAGVATVALLDMEPAMREGIPTSITTGAWWGLGNGLLLWGAQDERPDARGVLALLSIASAVGSAAGGLAGWATGASIAEARLTLSMGLWSGLTAWTSVLAFDARGNRFAYQLGLAALNLGTVAGLVIGAASDLSIEAVGLFNGGALMGALLGLGIAGLVHETLERDGKPHGAEITAAGVAIGTGSGILIGLLLLGLEEADRGRRARASPLDDFALHAAPVEGGLVVTAVTPL